jgi:hypothetical protein
VAEGHQHPTDRNNGRAPAAAAAAARQARLQLQLQQKLFCSTARDNNVWPAAAFDYVTAALRERRDSHAASLMLQLHLRNVLDKVLQYFIAGAAPQ